MFTMAMDRFAYGLPDPQEAPVIAECAWCGGEIYGGEVVEFDLSSLPDRTNANYKRISRNSDYMHVRCWDECAVALDLSDAECDLIANIVEL